MQEYYYILWQIFWVVTAIITVCAYMYSDKEKTLKYMLIWSLFWALQYLFLGAFSWLLICLFSFARILASRHKKNVKIVFSSMYVIITLIWVFTYTWYISLLPIIASYIGTYALFFIKGVQFRIALIIPTSLWLIYNFYVGSIWWTIKEIIILVLHIKVIVLSATFAYRKEIYTLNYDIFVYLYNNSISKFYILWKNFQHFSYLVSHPFSRKKKWVISKLSSH